MNQVSSPALSRCTIRRTLELTTKLNPESIVSPVLTDFGHERSADIQLHILISIRPNIDGPNQSDW